MPDVRVIANPAAGRGRGERAIASVSALLRDKGLDFELVRTGHAGHGEELARRALSDGCRTVVALGGDGTVNEVVNGLSVDQDGGPKPAEGVTLGVIPIGSGNDFAYAAGLPSRVPDAVERLAEGKARQVDVGCINDRLFVYGVGMGLIAEANVESRKITWLSGMPLYVAALFKALCFHYETYELDVTVDGVQSRRHAMVVTVNNGRRTAGAFHITPGARIDDGLLDLCLISPVSRLEIIRYLPLVVNGHHTGLDQVETLTGREIEIRSDGPLAAHVDGEVFGAPGRCYEFSVVPGALRVIC